MKVGNVYVIDAAKVEEYKNARNNKSTTQEGGK